MRIKSRVRGKLATGTVWHDPSRNSPAAIELMRANAQVQKDQIDALEKRTGILEWSLREHRRGHHDPQYAGISVAEIVRRIEKLERSQEVIEHVREFAERKEMEQP